MKGKLKALFLWLLCAAGIAAAVMQLPELMAAKLEYETEAAATPTPTADVRSMLAVTADPSVTPAPTVLLLRSGSKGDEVKKLQTRLWELGWYTGTVDGQYGPGTAEAVKAFQTQHGLSADGVAGEETRAAVYSSAAQTPAPTPTPTATPAVLKKGSTGADVTRLQKRLAELGYYTVKADGSFGSATEEALRTFQQQNGLDADGIAAGKTFAVLYSDAAKPFTPVPTVDPDAPPILVNRTHPVEEGYVPANLVNLKDVLPSDIVTVKKSDTQGDRTAAAALETMFRAAIADGISGWQISAGYRSYSYQKKLFNNSVQEYLDQGFSKSNAISATRQTVADPGTSEHHTGLAFDINVAGTTFKGTRQQKWLEQHCWEYGFIIRYQEDKEKITGYLAECWHVRYVGVNHSMAMYQSNQCLEEYLGILD